ncbi:MAG: hypothetical protein AB7G13_33725 [Lautropia sp.]
MEQRTAEEKSSAPGRSSLDGAKEALKEEFAAGKQTAADLADAAVSSGKGRVDQELRGSAGTIDDVREVVGQAAANLRDRQMDGIAGYTEHLAASLGSLSNRLRTSSVDQLAADARRFARDHPAWFITGSVAVGFALTRLLKAAGPTTGSRNAGEAAFGGLHGSPGHRDTDSVQGRGDVPVGRSTIDSSYATWNQANGPADRSGGYDTESPRPTRGAAMAADSSSSSAAASIRQQTGAHHG